MMEVHSHEASTEYFMRGPFTRSDETRWEDCRILTKFAIKNDNGRGNVSCTIECRLREDLGETVAYRPQRPVK